MNKYIFIGAISVFMIVVCNIVSCKEPTIADYWNCVLYKNINIEIRLNVLVTAGPEFYLLSTSDCDSTCSKKQLVNFSGELNFELADSNSVIVKIWPNNLKRQFEGRWALLTDTGNPKYRRFLGCFLRLNNNAAFPPAAVTSGLIRIKCTVNAKVLTEEGDTIEIAIKDRLLQKGEWFGNLSGH